MFVFSPFTRFSQYNFSQRARSRHENCGKFCRKQIQETGGNMFIRQYHNSRFKVLIKQVVVFKSNYNYSMVFASTMAEESVAGWLVSGMHCMLYMYVANGARRWLVGCHSLHTRDIYNIGL